MKTKLVLLSAFLGFLLAPMFSYAQTIKIYSERQPLLIEPLLKEFEEKTATKVQWIYSQKGLMQKVILEKNRPVADVYLSSDISRLIDIVEAGATIQLNQGFQVPSYLQSDDWVGLTQRARVFFVSEKFANQDLSYEDLIDDQFQGRVCTRSGFHPYNISLFASLLAHHGEEWLRDYLTTLKNNLARKPQGNDRDQVKAIYAGVCDISIGNHYYYFQMMENKDQKKWLEKAKIIFPNQTNRGAHVNISGIALLKEETREISEQLIAFLLSDAAQTVYANDNNEFPVSPDIPYPDRVQSLAGIVKFDSLDLEELASNRRAVINILNKINFDG